METIKFASLHLFLSLLASISLISCTSLEKHSDQGENTDQPYRNYVLRTEKKLGQMSLSQRSIRDTILKSLQENIVYKEIVTNKVVSSAYMPILNAIANGISQMTNEGFSIEEHLLADVEKTQNRKDEVEFAVKIVALSTEANSGLPEEIIEVFYRYKKKFDLFGEKGLLVDASGRKEVIAANYDISPIFGMLEPTNKEILNAIFEAKQKKLSKWPNITEATYPYLSSKRNYMAYLKKVFPESAYLSNVDYEVVATELFKAYETNEVAADEIFKDKRLEVSGLIYDIGKDILDNPYIVLRAGSYRTVNCYFSKQYNSIIAQLQKGQKVTLTGICAGMKLTSVVIQKCDLFE